MTDGIRNYLIVTLAYWGFTLTDGVLRMLVLLHFHKLGYSSLSLSFLFLLYEAAGIGANLIGGWLATRYGISRMLCIGLITQIFGFCLLSMLNPLWGSTMMTVWVVVSQGICGVAKDLTKTASKSAIKITSAKNQNSETLLYWVAWFTGSKNAMKGCGFFLGGILLEVFGFSKSLYIIAFGLGIVLLGVFFSLPPMLGKNKASKSVLELFAKGRAINLLALARVFMFGARDIWFVVGIPLYFYSQGFSVSEVGAFLAFWTIGYGILQGLAPKLISNSSDGLSKEIPSAKNWAFVLCLISILLAAISYMNPPDLKWIVMAGLIAFGFAFAINSSLHSYLILAYAGNEKTAEDVGFYYAANALGRFIGTLFSGMLYQWGGLFYTLCGSAGMLVLLWACTLILPTTALVKNDAEISL